MDASETRDSIIKRRGYRSNIVGDKFSLYISSYPVAIKYLGKRIGNQNKTLLELCCGVGVALENIAGFFEQVIGVDIDKKILKQCQHNLKNSGLSEKNTLILGDINDEELLKRIKADIVIYDVPYWLPHKFKKQGDLMSKNPPLGIIVERIRKYISKDIVIFCSPNFEYSSVKIEVGQCEFQKVYVNGKYDRNYVYLGNLMQKDGVTKIELSA